jgi:hypothetical protein
LGPSFLQALHAERPIGEGFQSSQLNASVRRRQYFQNARFDGSCLLTFALKADQPQPTALALEGPPVVLGTVVGGAVGVVVAGGAVVAGATSLVGAAVVTGTTGFAGTAVVVGVARPHPVAALAPVVETPIPTTVRAKTAAAKRAVRFGPHDVPFFDAFMRVLFA